MSSTPETLASAQPLTSDDLTGFFRRAERPDPAHHKVGTEHEKFGVVLDDRGVRPVEYRAHVLAVMSTFMERFGWRPSPERGDDGALIALERDGASITLEPGGQFELSGKPLANVHQTCQEFTQHQRELHEASVELGLAWFAAGFHPFATRDEVNWMPKPRYAVMRAFLPTRGQRGLDMMLRTCTVQANFDYASEVQCGRRFRVALGVSGLSTALFANSPYREGEDRGFASLRSDNWTDVDPARCGLLPWAFEGEFSYQRYVDWALDVPMFFIRRSGRYIPTHAPFRAYLAQGFVDADGTKHTPTRGDWELHLSTLFPEIRLKPFLEVRGCDSVPHRIVCALPALWKGILYDDDALEAAWDLVRDLSFDERRELWLECRRDALRAPRTRELCAELLKIARAGLRRAAILDSRGRDETPFLDCLDELVAAGTSLADLARSSLGPSPGRGVAARRAFVRAFYFAGTNPED